MRNNLNVLCLLSIGGVFFGGGDKRWTYFFIRLTQDYTQNCIGIVIKAMLRGKV